MSRTMSLGASTCRRAGALLRSIRRITAFIAISPIWFLGWWIVASEIWRSAASAVLS
ncbi:MAG: hypothetical protein ABI334_02245 [Candidatus Dormiibacterota bacterium]